MFWRHGPTLQSFAFDRNGGAPPGRGRRRTGPHRFDQMLERTAVTNVTNERTNGRTDERKITKNFKRPKNREDSSDFDDFWTELIAAP